MATADIPGGVWQIDDGFEASHTPRFGLGAVGHADAGHDDHSLDEGLHTSHSRLRPVLDTNSMLSWRRRSGTPDTAVAMAADAAIQQMLYYDYLKRNGRLNPCVEPTIVDRLSAEVSDVIHPHAERGWAARVLVPSVAVCVLAVTVASLFFAETPAHSVHGVLLAGTQPVVQATIVFRRFKGGEEPVEQQFITGVDGTFFSDQTRGIPSGLYAVVVLSPQVVVGKAPKPAAVPAIYRDATTTPLRVNVTDDLRGLRLSMRR